MVIQFRYFLLLLSFTCYALVPEMTYQPRTAIIMLDNSEAGPGPTTTALLAGLYQQSSPLIVSTSLIANLMKDYQPGSTKNKSLEQINKELTCGRPGAMRLGQTSTQTKNIFLDILDFDKNQWVIKKCGEGLCLLIPHTYLYSLGLDPAQCDQQITSPEATNLELELGIKVNHLEQYDIGTVALHTPYSFNNALYSEINDTKNSTLFCARSDYKNRNNMPFWTWYILGHGKIKSMIVGMSLESFKQLLTFMAQKLAINLLVYTSCYAAGTNEKIIYSDGKAGIQTTYPFTIITEAITDTPVSRGANIALEEENNKLQLKLPYNFTEFVSLTNKITIDFLKAIKSISPITPFSSTGEYSQNIPQIKVAGLEWFSVLESNKKVISLGKNLITGHNPKKPLDIARYFKTNTFEALLLYHNIIPFELIIDSFYLQAVIPMSPEELYILEGISSNKPIEFCISWFLALPDLGKNKLFYIKAINDARDIIIKIEYIPSGRSDVKDTYRKYAFYTDKDGIFKVAAPPLMPQIHPPYTTDEENKKEYRRLLSQAKGEVINYGKFFFVDNAHIDFPTPFNTGTIEAISTPDNSSFGMSPPYIGDIIRTIEYTKAAQAIIAIATLNGMYVEYPKIPGLKFGTRITLKDVFIDSQDIYYSYDGKFYKNGTLTNDYRAYMGQKMTTHETNISKHPLEDLAKHMRLTYLQEELLSLSLQLRTLRMVGVK